MKATPGDFENHAEQHREMLRLRSVEKAARAYIDARRQWDAGKVPAAVEYARLDELAASLAAPKS